MAVRRTDKQMMSSSRTSVRSFWLRVTTKTKASFSRLRTYRMRLIMPFSRWQTGRYRMGTRCRFLWRRSATSTLNWMSTAPILLITWKGSSSTKRDIHQIRCALQQLIGDRKLSDYPSIQPESVLDAVTHLLFSKKNFVSYNVKSNSLILLCFVSGAACSWWYG